MPVERAVVAAQRTSQQARPIDRPGPAVNLGNVDLADVLRVETLRPGLRADTAAASTGRAPR